MRCSAWVLTQNSQKHIDDKIDGKIEEKSMISLLGRIREGEHAAFNPHQPCYHVILIPGWQRIAILATLRNRLCTLYGVPANIYNVPQLRRNWKIDNFGEEKKGILRKKPTWRGRISASPGLCEILVSRSDTEEAAQRVENVYNRRVFISWTMETYFLANGPVFYASIS